MASLGGARSVLWLDEYTGDESRDEAVRDAVAEGRPVVVGLPADADGVAGGEATCLATVFGGVRVAQHLAAGSLIAEDDGAAGDVVHCLIY